MLFQYYCSTIKSMVRHSCYKMAWNATADIKRLGMPLQLCERDMGCPDVLDWLEDEMLDKVNNEHDLAELGEVGGFCLFACVLICII